MGLVKVAKLAQVKELEPILMEIGELSVGIYKFENKIYAYRNWCPHQGGPACEGKVRRVVEYELELGITKATSRPKIFCPWHGLAYDVTTGAHKTNKKLRLLPFKVVIENEDVLVDLPRVVNE